MNRVQKFASIMCAVLLLLLQSVSAYSQESRPSTDAYLNWKERHASLERRDFALEHIGIGFGAKKYQDIGVTVDITIGAGSSIKELPPLEFVVQPVSVRTDENGNNVIEKLGSQSVIKSPRLYGFNAAVPGVLTQPQLTTRMPIGANAVHISILGFGNLDQTFSITLPVREKASTAVIGKMSVCNDVDRSQCQWFTGSCGQAGEDCP